MRVDTTGPLLVNYDTLVSHKLNTTILSSPLFCLLDYTNLNAYGMKNPFLHASKLTLTDNTYHPTHVAYEYKQKH